MGDGGNGKRTTIAGPQYGVGTPGPGGTGGYLAGGGGGGVTVVSDLHHQILKQLAAVEKVKRMEQEVLLAGTGGGGGGGSWNGPVEGGKGGSGLVVLRYQIAELGASLKATGGNVSFYGSKTIHTFTSSGVFANTSGSPLSIEYVCLAGGGGGGADEGAGGGAGGYRLGTTTCPTSPSNGHCRWRWCWR